MMSSVFSGIQRALLFPETRLTIFVGPSKDGCEADRPGWRSLSAWPGLDLHFRIAFMLTYSETKDMRKLGSLALEVSNSSTSNSSYSMLFILILLTKHPERHHSSIKAKDGVTSARIFEVIMCKKAAKAALKF